MKEMSVEEVAQVLRDFVSSDFSVEGGEWSPISDALEQLQKVVKVTQPGRGLPVTPKERSEYDYLRYGTSSFHVLDSEGERLSLGELLRQVPAGALSALGFVRMDQTPSDDEMDSTYFAVEGRVEDVQRRLSAAGFQVLPDPNYEPFEESLGRYLELLRGEDHVLNVQMDGHVATLTLDKYVVAFPDCSEVYVRLRAQVEDPLPF